MARRGDRFGAALDGGGVDLAAVRIDVANPLHGAQLVVPEVELVTGTAGGPDRLEWRKLAVRAVPATRDCLSEFVQLHDGTPAQIHAYARRWGTLEIAPSGRPCGRFPDLPLGAEHRTWESAGERRRWRDHFGGEPWDWRGWEPTAAWRFWAARLRGTLLLAAALRAADPGESVARADWEAIPMPPAFDPATGAWDELGTPRGTWGPAWDSWTEFRSRVRRQGLAFDLAFQERCSFPTVVDELLDWAGLVPRLEWLGRELRVGLGSHQPDAWPVKIPPAGPADYVFRSYGLWVALILHVVASITSPLEAVFCPICGNPYTPTGRKPRWDKDPGACSKKCRRRAQARWSKESKQRAKAKQPPSADSHRDSQTGGRGGTSGA